MAQEPTAAQEDVIQQRIRAAVDEAAGENLAAQEKVIQGRINAGVREYQRRAAIGFVVLVVGIGGAIYLDGQHNADQRQEIEKVSNAQDRAIIHSGDVIAVSGCNRDYNTIDALRDELERQLLRVDALEKDGTLSPRLADASRQSTLELLDRYKLPDCRRADDILTARPGKKVRIPLARYPNDPQQRKSEAQEAKELGQRADVP